MAFLQDMVRSAGGTILLTGGRFIAMSIIGRRLGVEDFGIVAFCVFSVELLTLACLLGLPGVVTRYLPTAIDDGAEALARFRALCFGWVLAALAVALLVAPLVAHFAVELDVAGVLVFAIWSLLAILSAVAQATMSGALRFDLIAWASGISGIVFVLGAALLVWPGSVTTALAVLGAAAGVLAAPALLIGGIRRRHAVVADLPPARTILVFGVNVWLTGMTTVLIWSRGEMLAMKALVDERAIGLYGAAITIVALVWRAVALLQGAVGPHLARRIGEEDPEKLGVFAQPVSRLTLVASGLAALTLALFGTEIVVLAFGPDFREAGPIATLIAPGAAMAGMGTINLAVQFLSNGRFTRNIQIVGAVGLGIAAYLLIEAIGLPGAAVARSIVLIGISAALVVWLMTGSHRSLGRAVARDAAAVLAVVAAASALQLTLMPPVWLRCVLILIGFLAGLVAVSGTMRPALMLESTLKRLRDL